MDIVWDWNGTLLDDSAACVEALRKILVRRGLEPISLDYYRRNFSFPARDFYARIGIELDKEDWDSLAREYHDAYLGIDCGLAFDAADALEFASRSGARQYILSAMREDYLRSSVEANGISRFFDGVFGTDNLDGGSKAETAMRLAASLDAGNTVVIGDSLHDLEVARIMGAKCVLYSGGSHSPERLRGFAPVAATLVEAVERGMEGI